MSVASTSIASMPIELIAADQFTIQELADIYNQTRVDYLIPMAMSADRLGEYVHDFDVDLACSSVARTAEGEILGLIMLGVRRNLAWITRLGVLPAVRRHGAGARLLELMLANADAMGLEETHLEVIKNNTPAYNLFLSKGFQDTGEYLVMRRAPRAVSEAAQARVDWLDSAQALNVLQSYPRHLTWILSYPSMRNASNVQGVRIELPSGGAGWLVYRLNRFSLSHLVFHTHHGDPTEVGTQLLMYLYNRYPRHDTYAENIHVEDIHLPAMHAMGYFENFRRIEMRRIIN
jgi:ribosomal protein S18 acetylase RimI-like enzyme